MATTLTVFEQSALLIEAGGRRLAVDIGGLTGPDSLRTIGKPDAALVSHVHPDHFHREHLQAMAAPLYTVSQVASQLSGTPFPVHVHQRGDTVNISGTPFTVTYLDSDHGPNVGVVENVGFLIQTGDVSLYFLGDMFTPSQPPAKPFDVMLVPVGGGGYTFDPGSAAAFVQQVGHRGLAIPLHYTGADPDSGIRFQDAVGGICPVQVPAVGESLTF